MYMNFVNFEKYMHNMISVASFRKLSLYTVKIRTVCCMLLMYLHMCIISITANNLPECSAQQNKIFCIVIPVACFT